MLRQCLGVCLAVTSAALGAQAGNIPSREAPLLAMAGVTNSHFDVDRLNWMFDREISQINAVAAPSKTQPPLQIRLNKTRHLIGLPKESYFEAPASLEAALYNRSFVRLTSHPEITDRYDPLILKYAALYRLNPRLIKAIIAAESEFRQEAISPKGARGLMQVVPRTASYFGISSTSLFFGEDNITAGSAYLASLFSAILKNLGLEKAAIQDVPSWVIRRVIAAYHAGPRFLKNRRLYRSTSAYVKKVMRFYDSPISQIRNVPHPPPFARLFAQL